MLVHRAAVDVFEQELEVINPVKRGWSGGRGLASLASLAHGACWEHGMCWHVRP